MKAKPMNWAKPVDMRRGDKPVVYLVWVLYTSGNTSLYVIASCTKNAQGYRKGVSMRDNVIRAWIEIREVDHLFGETELGLMLAMDRRELHRLAAMLPLEGT